MNLQNRIISRLVSHLRVSGVWRVFRGYNGRVLRHQCNKRGGLGYDACGHQRKLIRFKTEKT